MLTYPPTNDRKINPHEIWTVRLDINLYWFDKPPTTPRKMIANNIDRASTHDVRCVTQGDHLIVLLSLITTGELQR